MNEPRWFEEIIRKSVSRPGPKPQSSVAVQLRRFDAKDFDRHRKKLLCAVAEKV